MDANRSGAIGTERTGKATDRERIGTADSRGFDGVIGMEHGNSVKGGEKKVIAAYVDTDRFRIGEFSKRKT